MLSLKMISNILFLVITITIPFVAPLSFIFNTFTPNNLTIHYEKSAYAANNMIQLTTNQRDVSSLASVGRATYVKPLQLWDKPSGKLTDFTTNFSFVINSLNKREYADGLSFFLAPIDSVIPDNVTKGGSMALTRDNEFLNSTDNPFVAVEFDIYSNDWDPPNEHVGIDINSMRSVANRTWWSADSIGQGKRHDAWIKYDSASKNLSVVFTGFKNNSYIRQRLSYIVDLREHLPEFVTFGFSAATGNASALHSIYYWSFSSNLEIQGNVTGPGIAAGPGSSIDPTSEILRPNSNQSKNRTGLMVGLGVGGFLLLVGLGVLLIVGFLKRRRRGRKMDEGGDDRKFDICISDEFERGSGPKKFPYNEVARATNNFSDQNKLGEGGFGGVYKGFLESIKSHVAVKRVSKGSKQGIKEYSSEVKIISRLRHRNLVQLLGWCHERKELLLVYEFMPNGSLDFHLFKGRSHLNWGTRFKIAQGLASALLYLHEEWEQCVVHRDIKSSNIMLDSHHNPKLGDFGLARLVDHDKGGPTTVAAGTMGYMAPECVTTGKSSKESDVFSFGVVALEIASGRRAIDIGAENGELINLIEWGWGFYGDGKVLEVADRRLGDDLNVREFEQLIVVGLWCAHPDSNLRPSIREAVLVLKFEAPLPVLPARMPVPVYCNPTVDMLSSKNGSSQTVSSSIKSDGTEYSKFTEKTSSPGASSI